MKIWRVFPCFLPALFSTGFSQALWSIKNTGVDQLTAVQFVDTNTGWAVGRSDIYATNSIIMKTTDGGSHWNTLTSGVSGISFQSLSFIDANTGWVAGGNLVLKTIDGGSSWTPESLTTDASIRGVQFVSSTTGFAVGGGYVFRTLNGGATWTSVATGTISDFYACSFLNASVGWAAGYDGAVYKTINGGVGWSKENTPGTGYPLISVHFPDSNTGYASGYGGKIVKTTNGGGSWVEQSSGVGQGLNVHFINANTGYAVSNLNHVLKTTDGGANWVAQSLSPVTDSRDWQGIAAIDENSVWIVGSSGSILRYWNHYPANPFYLTRPLILGTGTAMTPDTPFVTAGGVPVTYSATLPAGLTINSTNGIISGTPTTPLAAANYVVSATNAYGVGRDTLNITVLQTPSNISYSVNPAVYFRGTPIIPDTARVTGPVTRYSISPALTQGLSMDTNTGIITGTATAISSATNYTVRVYNGAVSAIATLNLTVVSAPSAFSYSSNPVSYGVSVAITPNNASITGTAPITFTTSQLATGLTLNAGTGQITGTPTVGGSATNYTITATNAYGSTNVLLNITVLAAPTGLSYSANPAQYKVGTAVAANTPTVNGTVSHYSINPSLPTGLVLDTITGVISGTPALPSPATNYTVTASSVAGSTTATLSVTVRLAPSNLSYSTNPASYAANTAITANVPSVQGTSPILYSVTPPLPAGIRIDSSTGIISGTPTAGAAAANYTVTATNPAGSTTATLNITVSGTINVYGIRSVNVKNGRSLSFSLQSRARVEISVIDSRGKIERKLFDENRGPGTYSLLLPSKEFQDSRFMLDFCVNGVHKAVNISGNE